MAASKKKTTTKDDSTEEEAPVEETSTEEEAPRTADEDTSTAPAEEPRPWRVETYSEDGKWGWRLCAANGVIISESGPFHDDQEAALSAANDESSTAGARVLDNEAGSPLRRAWT